jgi:hypothetical protein
MAEGVVTTVEKDDVILSIIKGGDNLPADIPIEKDGVTVFTIPRRLPVVLLWLWFNQSGSMDDALIKLVESGVPYDTDYYVQRLLVQQLRKGTLSSAQRAKHKRNSRLRAYKELRTVYEKVLNSKGEAEKAAAAFFGRQPRTISRQEDRLKASLRQRGK